MQRRGRLTYERLANSLSRLRSAVPIQFPDRADRERAQDLQRAISDALDVARAGVSGAAVASPVQLKREVEARIKEIHGRHDAVRGEGEEDGDGGANVSATQDEVGAWEVGERRTSSSDITGERREIPARKPSSHTLDSGKENANPPVPAPHPAKKSSGVKKTSIRKPATSKKVSSGIAKRITTRTIHSTPALPPSTATPFPTTDEAARRAAAATLIGLSSQSSNISFTAAPSSSTTTTPPSSATNRASAVYEDAALPTHPSISPKLVNLKPQFSPLPHFENNATAQAFLQGVEYAVQHFATHAGREESETGAGLWGFVAQELGLHGEGGRQGGAVQRGSEDVGRAGSGCEVGGVRGGSGGERGFWAVI